MSHDYFGRSERGGTEASKIEHQDAVATILALELICGLCPYADRIPIHSDWKLMAEGNDDLEVIADACRVFIQVKAAPVTPSSLRDVLQTFADGAAFLQQRGSAVICYFHLFAIGGLSAQLRSVEHKLNELRSSLDAYPPEEHASHFRQLCETYNLPDAVAHTLFIDTRQITKDSEGTFALFSLYVRRFYPIRDYSDQMLREAFGEICNELFAAARRARRAVNKHDVEKRLFSLISSPGLTSVVPAYVRTPRGYRRDRALDRFHRERKKALHAVRARIFREWIRYYWPIGLRRLLVGGWEYCMECRHPLMGGFAGLRGLQCPDCGYKPFCTLVLACECGQYMIVKRQPELSPDTCLEYIAAHLRGTRQRCEHCGRILTKEVVRTHWIVVPFPLPVQLYKPGRIPEYIKDYAEPT